MLRAWGWTSRALAALDEAALLAFLVEFVRVPSVFDPDAGTTEEDAARLVRDLLAGWGWSPRWEEVAPGRPNVIATLAGARAGRRAARRLIVEGHTDVVTPGDPAAWADPPFAATIRDGRLCGIPIVTYGPGDVTIPHQIDEFVRLTDVIAAARVHSRAILTYLQG